MTSDSAPDPIAILLGEHAEAAVEFDLLDAAVSFAPEGRAGARRVLEAVRTALVYLDGKLEIHIEKEEGPLFPRLKAALPADDRLIDEMVAEHDQARMKREDLRAALDDLLGAHDDLRDEREGLRAALAEADAQPDPARIDAVRRASRAVLQTLRIHFQNEEEIVFPLAPQLLSSAELAAVGHEMVAIEANRIRYALLVPEPLDLAAEYTALLASPEAARDGRTARTLVKDGPQRVVLVALRAGGRLQQHRAPGPVTIHALTGRVALTTANARHDLAGGRMIALPAGTLHEVEATEPSALLLTMAVPE